MSEIPAVVRTTIAALRTAATWLPDKQRDMLREAANSCETRWDGGCCPVCEEQPCDAGCPLEDVRAELGNQVDEDDAPSWPLPPGFTVNYRDAPDEQCDGTHPGIRHDGSTIHLYDLVTHPGCPHQPWAGDALRGYAEAKQSAAGSLRTMSGLLQDGTPMEATLGNLADAVAERLEVPSLFDWDGPRQAAQLPQRCYDASFGRVHVRPGCRC